MIWTLDRDSLASYVFTGKLLEARGIHSCILQEAHGMCFTVDNTENISNIFQKLKFEPFSSVNEKMVLVSTFSIQKLDWNKSRREKNFYIVAQTMPFRQKFACTVCLAITLCLSFPCKHLDSVALLKEQYLDLIRSPKHMKA